MPNHVTNAPPPSVVSELLNTVEVQKAFLLIDRDGRRNLQDMVRICEIPAPPFKEQERGEYLRRRLQEAGLSRVEIDEEGNCIATRPGRSESPVVVVSAHLDTVFPEGTDVRVRQEGRRFLAPGISDNACGIASLLSLASLMESACLETEGTIHFVGTVGEEGEGNLRGVRHLFTSGRFRSGVDSFVSLDGPGLERITHRALGSRRYRVTVNGPGGHSWGDFGIVNPVNALGQAIALFAAYPAPTVPRTSFNVGVIEGGNSVNAIPQQARMAVDLRSVSDQEIDRLERHLRRSVDVALREENARRVVSNTTLTCTFEMVGDRPSGETPVESDIVRAAMECSRQLGIEPRLDCSSTDSNIPISLGIPAITIGVGGVSGNCHCLTEWYEPLGREVGLKRLLLLTLELAGRPD
jgi:tripeptide aminopeptidase